MPGSLRAVANHPSQAMADEHLGARGRDGWSAGSEGTVLWLWRRQGMRVTWTGLLWFLRCSVAPASCIDRELVHRIIWKQHGAFRACYDKKFTT